MKILLGTHYLAKTGGTESYTYALALELKRLGHHVEYFAIVRGNVSSMLEENGVPFMSADYYDLILANHTTVVEKICRFGYIVQTCHGNIAELEQPSPYADAYVAVSEEVRNHLQYKGYQVLGVIPNGIDCKRFFPRNPVSDKLTTVLSLCQSDEANKFIRKCCEQANIKLLCSNKFTDNVWSIEELINQSDLVVGLGRSAYDAMACGRCVLVYDYRDYMGEFLGDGILTPDSINKSMTCNCSGRANRLKYNEQDFIAEMQKYSPQLAAWSRDFAIQNLNIEQAVDKYLSICDNIDYKRQYCKLKLDLFDMKAKYQQALDVNIDIKSGLKSQLTNHQQESANIIASYRAKGQKHLRVIRFLLWLCIVLSIINLVIVFVA